MDGVAQGFVFAVERTVFDRGGVELVAVVVGVGPEAFQVFVRAFDAAFGPFEGGFGRRGEHGVEAGGVGAVFFDQRFGVHAVVFRFGHFFHATVLHGLAVGDEGAAGDAAFVVKNGLNLSFVKPYFFTRFRFAIPSLCQHHALGQQAFEGFADFDEAFVAHQFGEEAGVEQVEDGVLDAADVLVHVLPVGGVFWRDHAAAVVGRHIAEEVPARFDEGVHGVGFAACGATLRVCRLVVFGQFGER